MNHHIHASPVRCFLDCPGWRLLCGHPLAECHPECPRWGGVDADDARAHGEAVLARIKAREDARNAANNTGDAA